MKKVLIKRTEYFDDTTISQVFIDGVFFCFCLEDTVRPKGIKVKHYTAIPSGNYNAIITYSNKFNRDMIQLYNSIDSDINYTVTDGICSWYGIRIHGGNTHKDTDGCLLFAYDRVGDKVIQHRADLDFLNTVYKWIENEEDFILRIENSIQEK